MAGKTFYFCWKSQSIKHMKRPFPVTLTFWMVLILTIWNAIKAWTFLSWRMTLFDFSTRYPPLAGAVAGIFWVMIGLAFAWGLRQGKPWSAKTLPFAAAGYIIWYWVERLFWQSPRPNSLFVIVFDLASLILVYSASKLLSREAYERNIENQATE